MKPKYILFISFIFLRFLSFSQQITDEWTIVNQNDNNFTGWNKKVICHDDGYIYVGGNYWSNPTSVIFISKYDSSGNVLWTKYYTNYSNKNAGLWEMIIENNYIYILGSLKDTATSKIDFLTLKYTTNGLLLLDLVYNAPEELANYPKAIFIKNNYIYVVGNIKDTNTTNYTDIILIKYDSNGFLKWTASYGNQWNTNDRVSNIIVDNENNVYVSLRGQTYAGSGLNLITNKYNSNGELLWSKGFDNPFILNSFELYNNNYLYVDNNQNIYVFSDIDTSNMGYSFPVILKYDVSGNLIFSVIDTTDLLLSNLTLKTSNFFVDSNKTIHTQYLVDNYSSSLSKSIVYAKYDSLGNKQFYKKWTTNSYNKEGLIYDFLIDNKNNLYCTGLNFINNFTNNYDAYCATEKIDSNNQKVWIGIKNLNNFIVQGYSLDMDKKMNLYIAGFDNMSSTFVTKYCGYCNLTIKGTVYIDENGNCIKDSTEAGLPNVLLKTEPVIMYSTSDSLGNFTFLVDTGTYDIKQVLPNEYWVESCPSNQQYIVNLSHENNEVTGINFGNKVNIFCPLLNVDISTPRLRRCFSNNEYIVSYSNYGTVTSENTYINIKFDEFLMPISSTFPWSDNVGNTYTFNVGTLAQNESGYFIITCNVSCDAILGQTLCTEANIFPDTLCLPVDSVWDKSSIKITGECVGDSLVCFVIKNNGESMNGNSYFKIFYDNFFTDSISFQLNEGDSLIKCVEANGQTIRLEAEQRPGHPGNSHPRAIIELCGNSLNQSLGFVNTVSQDDESLLIDVDCHEIIGSFDPNDKIVTPKGITNNNFIPQNTLLQYRIDFQNTGTDTAFTVIILDTISQYLNIESIEFGSTSHNCTHRIYNDRVVEWRFNNILLPDSNTNEPESHGFVSYKIKLIQNLEKNTKIENKAGIVFDYNSAIITNTTLNTINDTVIINYIPIKEQIKSKKLQIFPNPSNGQITISTEKETIESIEIYNSIGSKSDEILLKNINTSYIYNNIKKLNGLYFIKVKTEENIYIGKVLFQ